MREVPPDMIKTIQGAWRVQAKRGTFFHPLNLLGDVKHIDGTSGYNLMKGKAWGWFSIEIVDDATLMLNYDDERNDDTLRKVRDIIKRDGEHWLGTLYLCNWRQFEFRLVRVHDKLSQP